MLDEEVDETFGPYRLHWPPQNGGERGPISAGNVDRFPVLLARWHDPVEQFFGLARTLQQSALSDGWVTESTGNRRRALTYSNRCT
jgi:hypothetical protein